MVLTAPVPKWATVLSSSRRFRMGIRSAHPGGDGLSSWYTSKNRPDAAGRGLLHNMDRSEVIPSARPTALSWAVTRPAFPISA
jgi:hypothetical protein